MVKVFFKELEQINILIALVDDKIWCRLRVRNLLSEYKALKIRIVSMLGQSSPEKLKKRKYGNSVVLFFTPCLKFGK